MSKKTYFFRYTDLLFSVDADSREEALEKAMILEGTKTDKSDWDLINVFCWITKQYIQNYEI